MFYSLISKILAADGETHELLNPLGSGTISDLINQIIDALVKNIAPPIFTAVVLYAAFQILTAGGDPEKFKNGKKTILYAVVGYSIILMAWGISSIIKDLLGI